MIELNLSRDRCGTAQLRLPADISAYQELLNHQEENGGSAGVLKITHVNSPVENLGSHLVYTPILDFPDLSKLNTLAEQIDNMDQRKQRIFSGVLDAEEISGLGDILRIAGSLDQYEVIDEIASDRDLGKWVIENGQFGSEFPESVRPYLDYAAVGVRYRSDHGGIYTQTGYVKKREEVPVQAEESRTMLLALKTSARNYPLVLPASEERLEQVKRALGVDDFSQAVIDNVEYAAPYLDRLIPTDCITVEDANELALCLQEFSENEMRTYRAALSVEEPDSFSTAIDMAMDIDDYELVLDSEREYAREALRRIGADGCIYRTSSPMCTEF